MSYPVAVDRNLTPIAVCDPVLVAWGDTEHPATIRRIHKVDKQTVIEVLWRSEISVSCVPPSSVRLAVGSSSKWAAWNGEASEIVESERLELGRAIPLPGWPQKAPGQRGPWGAREGQGGPRESPGEGTLRNRFQN